MEEIAKLRFLMGPLLGQGGFGAVYRARMYSPGGLETDVAIKMLKSDEDPSRQALQRLRDEGHMLARLNHPTILRVYDLTMLRGCASLITEFVDGLDLSAFVKGGDRIPLRPLVEVVGSVAAALDAAWSTKGPDGKPLEMVHRDIKPSNIRISRHGQVKLLDFGIARTDGISRMVRTQTDMMVGSPAYMAPERYLSAAVYSSSDAFALGCCLYEGVVGVRFFKDVSMPILSVLAIDPRRYETYHAERFALIPKDTPPGVVQLLTALLAYAHEQRPTVGAVARQCEDLLEQIPGASVSRWAKARRWDDPAVIRGDLTDRTLVEEVFTTDTRSRPLTEQRPPTPVTPILREHHSDSVVRPKPTDVTFSGRRVGLAAFGVASVVGAVALLVAIAVGVGFTISWSLADEADPDVRLTDPEIVPEPIPRLDTAVPPSDPAPETPEVPPPKEVIKNKETAPPKKDPSLAVVTPPVPTPIVDETPKPPERGNYQPDREPGELILTADGNVSAYVSGSDGRFDLPAAVPPGKYDLFASFDGKAPILVRSVTVIPNTRYNVKCGATMERCTLK